MATRITHGVPGIEIYDRARAKQQKKAGETECTSHCASSA
jgi:hypothetical protein